MANSGKSMNIRLVWDSSECTMHIGNLAVVAAPKEFPPFECQAIVEEQDTWLVLGESTSIEDPGKPPWYLANILEHSPTHALGSVLARGRRPVRFQAIVNDVDQEPMCRPESVREAYKALMTRVHIKGISSLAMPPLGSVHGNLPVEESLRILNEVINESRPEHLYKLWLILPPDCDHTILSYLAQK